MKLNNLFHPLGAARKAKASLAAHISMWKFGNHGRGRFRGDPRYDLEKVSRGFASRIDETFDDTALLKRICAAYNASVARQTAEPHAFTTVEAWDRLHEGRLSPSIRALLENDTESLAKMYRNFYRDPCSAGLLAPPSGMSKAYFGGRIKDIYRHFYMSHVLYRLDYWKEITSGRFQLKDLAGPGIGNPFGVTIDGTHIGVGAEYAHYCADRVVGLMDRAVAQRSATRRTAVAEIGGGFGAIAYYLLRDRRSLTYFNFDVPERAALSSYYLMRAFPQLTFLLYGEKPLTSDTISQPDAVLLPAFALAAMPRASVDIAFSSNGLANFSPDAVNEALRSIVTMTRDSLLYIGNETLARSIAGRLGNEDGSFTLADKRMSGWHSHKVSGAGVGGAAGLAASTLHEQTFTRNPAAGTKETS
ncbi:MAG TPA: putative sugar O-methyltransferase [Terracidiphilus sp.]|nr:putative sugar O-methyltransferase [Terracidiphilus sp.]